MDLKSQIVEAAERGDAAKVHELLAAGAEVDAVTNGRYPWTPLMHAAFRGHLEVAKILLGAGASVSKEDLDSFTAATLAAGEEHWDVLKLLAKHGADLDHADGYGHSARYYAKRANREDALVSQEPA